MARICDERSLTYFGFGGTGIGAIRHKGFIPWDDDIDIGMPAQDLEQLIKVIREEHADVYDVIDASIDSNYPLATTRIMLKGTQFCEETLAELPLDLGIFLDMYAFDNVADDEVAYRKQAWDAWFWSHIRILISVPRPVILIGGWKGALLRVACASAYGLARLLHLSPQFAYRREREARERYANVKTRRIGYLHDTDRFTQTLAWTDIKPLLYLDFEDMKLPFPQGIDTLLKVTYGDYMQLPPVEKRKNHFPARLDFGPY
ncbi:LicD family protein [Olsenella urininfantis]|uniref:LicD family protein n=1 Tax=Olsenella urininfantis TaxID=1871033 RepID=UPI001F1706ED|nr:LicD family protein [Olsenella urininfantis]